MASQRRAIAPWAAWNSLTVGMPAGGGASERSVKKPASAQTVVMTASRLAARPAFVFSGNQNKDCNKVCG